jgi:hypothetical protein
VITGTIIETSRPPACNRAAREFERQIGLPVKGKTECEEPGSCKFAIRCWSRPLRLRHLTTMNTMSCIFISYKSTQRHLAFLVRDRLRDWGHEIWLDADRLQPGTYWANEIDEALKTCDACIAIMTPISLQSRQVTNEWDMIIMQGKLLIPLMFERTAPHYKYIDIQYIDFTGVNQETGFARLRERLTHGPDEVQRQAIEAPDPYRGYLQQLYDRINKYLAAKLITTLRSESGRPEPIKLAAERTEGAVGVVSNKREPVDPLFVIGGISNEPEAFDAFSTAFAYFGGRVLLLGDPGAGKTITLLHSTRDAVVKRRQDPAAPLPILGIIPTWNPDQQPDLGDWLGSSYGAPENAAQLIRDGRALLFLDGLDELGDKRPVNPDELNGPMYDPRLRFITSIPANNPVVVTCRTGDYYAIGESIALRGAITLRPLTDNQQLRYLHAQPELMQLMQHDSAMKNWFRNPLLLSFFAFAYEHMTQEERFHLGNFASVGELRDKVFDTYLQERYRHELNKRQGRIRFSLEEICAPLQRVSLYEVAFDRTVHGAMLSGYFSPPHLSEVEHLLRDLQVVLDIDAETPVFVHSLLRDFLAYREAVRVFQYERPDADTLTAIRAFGNIRDQRCLPPLIHALRFTQEWARDAEICELAEEALRTHMRYEPERVRQALIEAAGEPNASVRAQVAGLLSACRDEETISVLTAMLQDEAPTAWGTPVKYWAETALRRIEDARDRSEP